MTKHSIMIDFDDPRAIKVAEVISNKSCKKMLSLLSSKELSESEIASHLDLPVSTVNYNMKKLIVAGLVQKSKSLLSSKGKPVPVYRLSEKHIVISPKTLLRGTMPALVVTGIFALGLKAWTSNQPAFYAKTTAGASALVATNTDSNSYGGIVYSTLASAPLSWAWFFLGALMAILIVLIWNWRKQ